MTASSLRKGLSWEDYRQKQEAPAPVDFPKASFTSHLQEKHPLHWGSLGVRLGQDPADSGARASLKKKGHPSSLCPSRDLSTLPAMFWTLWDADAARPTVVGAGLSERGDASFIFITWDHSGQEAPTLGPC